MSIPESIEAQGGPISLVFSKTGRAFFSERITGNVWEILGTEEYSLIKHFLVTPATGHHETGLFGIALDPDFEKNGYIYAVFTTGKDTRHATNSVVRFSVNNNAEKVLLAGIPAARIHNGGILAFGPDGKLYVGIGVDNLVKEKSQDKKYLGGKVLRINSDGSIPSDNPFKNSPVYSLGHRNVFGVAFNPQNGKLYVADVGPDNDDEINIIEAGKNYGWPNVVGYSHDKRLVDPIYTYTPVITPTQMLFYKNDLYFASFNEGSVHKLVLSDDGNKVVSDAIVYRGKPFGAVGVFVSPAQEFFVATTNRILKVKLESEERSMKKNILMWIIAAIVVIAIVVGAIVLFGGSKKANNNTAATTTPTPTQQVTAGMVTIQNLNFTPSTITISKGDTVTWQNNDSFVHHVVADDGSFDLGDVNSGGTSRHTFDTAGTFNWHLYT